MYFMCESVVHALWECLAYSSSKASFMVKPAELSGDSYNRYADFELEKNLLSLVRSIL